MYFMNLKLIKFVAGCVFACYLFSLTQTAFAIEGLNISIPAGTNVILSWPSDTSETYLIQYRHTLDASDSWTTLADYYAPDFTTNITCFYDTNLDFGSGNTSGGSNIGNISLLGSSRANSSVADGHFLTMDEIMAMLMLPVATDYSSGLPQKFNRNSPAHNNPTPMDTTNSVSNSEYSGTGFYRVVRDGVHLIGITNDMVLSGVVQIPLELGNNYGYVSCVGITENQSAVGNSTQTLPIMSPGFLTLDTTIMANGVHQINGSATWEDTNGGIWEADSPAISVTISNEISFENWFPVFGELDNTLLIRATSAHTDTDWQIDVYDSANSYIGSFVGHTYDGDIYVVWNLQDYYGNYHTNDNFFTCKISTPYADPPKPTYKVTDPWPTTGAWAAACQHAWNSSLDPDSLYQQLNGFVGFGGAHGGVYPTPSSDGSPYALTFDPEDPRGDVDWNQFRQVLFHPYVRNLIYFGHGGQNGLGYDPAIFNRYITAAEIANRLHTIPAGQTNRHAFRFVFIDACSTAAGNLPEAFGILHRENVPFDDYVNSSTRFSAYVGWPKEKAIGLMNARYPNYDHVNFMAWIQFEMMTYGNGVKQAIRNASHYPNVHWFGEDDLKVYGYWNLTIGGNNN